MKKNFKKGGFVMLFSAVIASIILAIALGVMNIALKELAFDTSAKNTNDAFFAADTAAECALYYDLAVGDTSAFGIPSAGLSVSCAGTDLDLNNGNNAPSAGPYSFSLYPLSPSGSACANVTVNKTTDPESTTILARGYNLGGNTTDCTSSNQNRVERELLVTIGEGPAIVPPESFTLTVNASGPGVVTSSLFGINCGNGNTNCQASYNAGTPIILTATPDPGYVVNWSGGGCSGNSTTCSFTMDVNRTVNATFSVLQHNVTIALSGPSSAGSVTSSPAGIGCSPICGTSFDAGEDVVLTATANPGYGFVGWSGPSGGECSGNTCNFNNLGADKSVTATFILVSTYPQVAGFASSQNGDATNHTVSLPAGIEVGDLLLGFFSVDGNNTTVTWPSAGSGWTVISQIPASPGSTTNTLSIAYKVASLLEVGSPSISVTTGSSQPSVHQVFLIDKDTFYSTGSYIQISTRSNGNSTSPNSSSLAASWGSSRNLWLTVTSRNNATFGTPSYPTNYTNGFTNAVGTGTDGQSLGIARREREIATEDPGVFTYPTDAWLAYTVVIRGL